MPTKRHLPLLLASLAAPLYAQNFAQGPALPPQADAPQHYDMGNSHKCQPVHNGDIVHYTLDIRGTQYARAVFSNIHMRLGRVYVKDETGLPEPDFRNLGGGGAATPDGKYGNLYHFTFRVPNDVVSGVYHGAGVYVSATDSFDPTTATPVDVSGHTLKHVRDFCLIVVSPYGDRRRVVTDFRGDRVERVANTPASMPPSSRVYLPSSPTTYPIASSSSYAPVTASTHAPTSPGATMPATPVATMPAYVPVTPSTYTAPAATSTYVPASMPSTSLPTPQYSAQPLRLAPSTSTLSSRPATPSLQYPGGSTASPLRIPSGTSLP